MEVGIFLSHQFSFKKAKERKNFILKNNSLEGNNNKNEIRNNCELYLNDKKINFTFKYSFSNKGINKINIKCKKDLIMKK